MTEDMELNEITEESLPAFKVYARFQIILTILSDIFCMVFVAAITLVLRNTGNERLIWLYLIPALCYLFG